MLSIHDVIDIQTILKFPSVNLCVLCGSVFVFLCALSTHLPLRKGKSLTRAYGTR
jgi:hypothetical protein